MKIHELKILPEFYEEVASGRKTFELRKDDRGFRVGDKVWLREWTDESYTGRDAMGYITYVLRDCPEYGLADGWCILSLGNMVCGGTNDNIKRFVYDAAELLSYSAE